MKREFEMSGTGQNAVEVVDPWACDAIQPKRLAEVQEPPLETPRTYGILVVDDEEVVRRVLSISLPQQGFALWLAADGQEALEVYQRHREAIDVVLLDVRMPRLDGPHTLAALQRLNPQIRCCFMSGDPGAYSEAELHNLGAVVVFPKPFHLIEVAQVLRKVVSDIGCKPPSV